MTAPEPSFAVPLSALIDIWDYCQDGWLWSCRVRGHCAPAEANSQAEARSAAIAHLADVHGITPLVEETGEAAALPGWEQHLRSLASGGAQFVDQVSLQLVVEELARLRAEVARLRSAGDGAADVERRPWSANPGEPICNRMYSGEHWVAKTCIKALGHDSGHADWYGRTWNQDERDVARLRSAGDGAADVLGKSAEWGLVNDRGDLTLVPAPDRVTLRHLADSYVVRSVTRGEWVVPLDSRSPKPDPWSPEPEVRARPNRCYHGVAIGNSCPLCRFESRCEADR